MFSETNFCYFTKLICKDYLNLLTRMQIKQGIISSILSELNYMFK